jgi:hypothetical protein
MSEPSAEREAAPASTSTDRLPGTVPPPAPVGAGTSPSVDLEHPTAPPVDRRPHTTHRARSSRHTAVIALAATSTALLALSAYLWAASEAWQDRAETYATANTQLGSELASSTVAFNDVSTELDAVRIQLTTAQDRIIELADEKAQIGDDREAQRMLADYQERVSEAAGTVALALERCVQGQNQLIGYMENADSYDPVELDAYAAEVQSLCQNATDANTALQRELNQ